MSQVEVDGTIALLMGRIAVLEELVRWLSLGYDVNEPVFAGADGQGSANGQPLGSAPQLHTLWHQVVGREHVEPTVDRQMISCPTCGHWHPEVTL